MSDNLQEKLSVLIITFNEELHIKSLLEDIDFADEIIVVDSFSTDRTIDIIKSFEHVRCIQHHFSDYTSQRNFTLEQAKNDWVLFIDADERVTPALKREIIKSINSPGLVAAYFMYRTFMFKDKKLRFSGWQTDKIYRLFNKTKCRYNEEKLVHEKLIVEGETGILQNKLIHYSFKSFQDYKQKMYNYGVLKANERLQKGQQASLFLLIFHPVYTFLYQFVIRLGFLDGIKGITICYLNAYSTFIRYKELKKLTSSRT